MRSSDWISDVCSSDLLQGFDHGLGDRRTLFSGRRLACRRRYQLAIVTRPDRLKLQCRDDLARVFPARFVALGVELEHCRVAAPPVGATRTTPPTGTLPNSHQQANSRQEGRGVACK